MTKGRLSIGGPRGMLPAAWRLLRSEASVRVLLGGYGSGKTTAAATAILAHALRSPWRPEYGDDEPQILVIGMTEKVIKDSSYKVFHRVCPRELIRKEWRSHGEWRTLLDNGVSILWRTWGGSIEGISAIGAWIDEAHPLNDPSAFANYAARLRDPIYVNKPLFVTGLPEFGWLYDTFGPEANYPDCELIHASTYENQYLLEHDIAGIRAAVPASQIETYLLGRWAKPLFAIYYEWDPAIHLVDRPGNKQQHCHLSIDVGERAAVLWWQEGRSIFRRLPSGIETTDPHNNPQLSLHVVDELLPERASAREIMRLVKERDWLLLPGRSLIFVDPSTDRDELDAIAAAAPGVRVVKKRREDEGYRVEEGIRCVNAALRDADGWVRVTVFRGLARTPRSLIPSIPRLRRKDTDPEKPHKDNATDHVALDAFRYPIAHLLPLKRRGVNVHTP